MVLLSILFFYIMVLFHFQVYRSVRILGLCVTFLYILSSFFVFANFQDCQPACRLGPPHPPYGYLRGELTHNFSPPAPFPGKGLFFECITTASSRTKQKRLTASRKKLLSIVPLSWRAHGVMTGTRQGWLFVWCLRRCSL